MTLFDPDTAPLDHEEITAYAEVQSTRLVAEQDPTYELRCLYGEKLFFVEHYRALAPGHCYSEAGVREARMSSCCEFHFDMMFGEDEE